MIGVGIYGLAFRVQGLDVKYVIPLNNKDPPTLTETCRGHGEMAKGIDNAIVIRVQGAWLIQLGRRVTRLPQESIRRTLLDPVAYLGHRDPQSSP